MNKPHNFNETEFLAMSLNAPLINIYECRQGKIETCANYMAQTTQKYLAAKEEITKKLFHRNSFL